MSELKNSWHTELAIGILINDEPTLENKLDLLTEIGLTASNKETFAICEKFRNKLCDEEVQKGREDLLPSPKTQRIYKVNPRKEKSHEVDDGE